MKFSNKLIFLVVFSLFGCNAGSIDPATMASVVGSLSGSSNLATALRIGGALNTGGSIGKAQVSQRPDLNRKKLKKIAILVEDGRSVPSALMENEFLKAMLPKGYDVVSRKDTEIAVKEMGFQGSSITEKAAAKFGRILSVPSVLVVKLTQLDSVSNDLSGSSYQVKLGARIIDVATTKVMWIASNSGNVKRGQSTNSLIGSLAGSIGAALPHTM